MWPFITAIVILQNGLERVESQQSYKQSGGAENAERENAGHKIAGHEIVTYFSDIVMLFISDRTFDS